MRSREFQRGARLAADIAETFNATSMPPYWLGDYDLNRLKRAGVR